MYHIMRLQNKSKRPRILRIRRKVSEKMSCVFTEKSVWLCRNAASCKVKVTLNNLLHKHTAKLKKIFATGSARHKKSTLYELTT